MSYGYTDKDDDFLSIEPGVPGTNKVYIGIVDHHGPSASVLVATEDAPAVALAILEAAGVSDESTPTLASAYSTLRRHVETQKREAEREAEDAKVVAFHGAIGANLDRIERHHRDLYRAAREFFAKEANNAR